MSNSASSGEGKLGPVSVFALAAGGMVGGGIYVALGVVVKAAGQWAWLSFLLAGLVAVSSAFSYARLSVDAGRSGGAFEFLEEMDREGLAGTLSWLLLGGYVLTIALYAYAFGQYVANAFGGGEWLKRGLAIAAMWPSRSAPQCLQAPPLWSSGKTSPSPSPRAKRGALPALSS